MMEDTLTMVKDNVQATAIKRVPGCYAAVPGPGGIIKAFVPADLPPDPPVSVDSSRLQSALSSLEGFNSLYYSAEEHCGKTFRNMCRWIEAICSVRIERMNPNPVTALAYLTGATEGGQDERAVFDYIMALDDALMSLKDKSNPVCGRLLKSTHAILMSGYISSGPGAFRRIQNRVFGATPEEPPYTPPPADLVAPLMANLDHYINSPDVDPIVKAAVAHAQFETIHPFVDGNGRTGRILILMILKRYLNAEGDAVLYLSRYLYNHVDEYFSLLNNIRTEGDWESWVDFFLKGVEETARDAVSLCADISTAVSRDAERMPESAAHPVRAVFDFLSRFPAVSATTIARRLVMPEPDVIGVVSDLMSMGIVQVSDSDYKNMIVSYTGLMNCLFNRI